MNLRTLIIASVFFSSVNCVSQLEKVQFELEKTTFKYSINAGIYKSRLPGANEIENSFKNFSVFAQVYFPFKRSLDIPKSFQKNEGDSMYYERLFSISPIAVFHLTEKGGNAVGMGQEMSFKLQSKLFIKSQIAVVWVESNAQKNDGLQSGLNFHHYWHISYYLKSNTYMSIGYNHISNGKIFSKEVGALFDMIVIGVSHRLANKNNLI